MAESGRRPRADRSSADPSTPSSSPARSTFEPATREGAPDGSGADEAFLCERCGSGMFRMHAVWRCPSCGFKTDCCGW